MNPAPTKPGRWVASLPHVDPYPDPREHGEDAIAALATALYHERMKAHPSLLHYLREAAAHVRAWRLSLPPEHHGQRQDDLTGFSDRALIRVAILVIVNADRHSTWHLRGAEAALRILGKRLAREVES